MAEIPCWGDISRPAGEGTRNTTQRSRTSCTKRGRLGVEKTNGAVFRDVKDGSQGEGAKTARFKSTPASKPPHRQGAPQRQGNGDGSETCLPQSIMQGETAWV